MTQVSNFDHGPSSSQERKDVPLCSGVFDYFPDALMEVAKVSKAGNDKHNPGEPMHHARGKSADHADALARHLIDRGKYDSEGLRHSAEMAWRALALLQEECEKERQQTDMDTGTFFTAEFYYPRGARPDADLDAASYVEGCKPKSSHEFPESVDIDFDAIKAGDVLYSDRLDDVPYSDEEQVDVVIFNVGEDGEITVEAPAGFTQEQVETIAEAVLGEDVFARKVDDAEPEQPPTFNPEDSPLYSKPVYKAHATDSNGAYLEVSSSDLTTVQSAINVWQNR